MTPSEAMVTIGSETLGLALVGFATSVLFVREALKWLRNQQPDFLGVFIAGAGAALLIVVIPRLGDELMRAGSASLRMMEGRSAVLFEQAFRAAIRNQGDCSQLGVMDSLALLVSFRGWLLIASFLGLIAMMLIKLMVIDIAWKLVFTLVVVLAPVSISLGVFTETGYGPLIRALAGVALWPVLFGVLLMLATAPQAHSLTAVKEGRATLSCSEVIEDAGEGGSDAPANDLMSWVRFMASTWVMAVLTWKLPQLSAWVVGGQAPGAFGAGVVAIVTNPAASVGGSALRGLKSMDASRRDAEGKSPSSVRQAATMGALASAGLGAVARTVSAPFKKET